MKDIQFNEGDNVMARIPTQGREALGLGGHIHQVVTSTDGHVSYILLLPVQVGAESLRKIVPVQELTLSVSRVFLLNDDVSAALDEAAEAENVTPEELAGQILDRWLCVSQDAADAAVQGH